MWSSRVKADGSGLLSWWLITPAAAGVKLERPTGRATLTPVTTGAGSWEEKAWEGRRAGLKRPVGPPARQDPHDVRSPAGLLSHGGSAHARAAGQRRPALLRGARAGA